PSVPPMPITTVFTRPVLGSSMSRLTLPMSLPSAPRTALPITAFASTSKLEVVVGLVAGVDEVEPDEAGGACGGGGGVVAGGAGFDGFAGAGCAVGAGGFVDRS